MVREREVKLESGTHIALDFCDHGTALLGGDTDIRKTILVRFPQIVRSFKRQIDTVCACYVNPYNDLTASCHSSTVWCDPTQRAAACHRITESEMWTALLSN